MRNYSRLSEVEPEEFYARALSAPRTAEEHELVRTEAPGAGREPEREEDGIDALVADETRRLNPMPKRFPDAHYF